VLLPGVLLLLFGALMLYAARDALAPRLDVQVVPVVVKRGGGTAGSVVAQAAGWLEPDPFPIHVSALTDGVIEEVLALEGRAVKAGEVVARMVADDAHLALERAHGTEERTKGRLAAAQAALRAAQTDWENPVERTRAVGVAEATLAGARADRVHVERVIAGKAAKVAELQDRLDAETTEVASGAVSEFIMTQTRLRLATASAELGAEEARRAVLDAAVQSAEAELEAARENLRLRVEERLALDTARASVDRERGAYDEAVAAREEAELRLDRMEIRAPEDGVVMTRLVNPGTKLMLGMDSKHSAHALHLYHPERLQVRVDVALADAARVGVGQPARVVVDVLPDRTFDGEVTRVVHEADIQKNTLQVKVAIKDPVPDLKPEMLARVRFLGAAGPSDATATSERLYAPERLLTRTGSGAAWVYAVDKGRDVVERRELTLGGAVSEGWVEIVSGLRPGDALVDGGQEGVVAGARVRIVGEDDR
jgi:RND family efflux transporter MFP subunit